MISNTLSSIITNLSNAYDMASTMGATIPASRNMENLASTIGTIPTAGGGGEDTLERTINHNLFEYSNDNITTIDTNYFTYCKSLNLPNCFFTMQNVNLSAVKSLKLDNLVTNYSGNNNATYLFSAPKLSTLNLPYYYGAISNYSSALRLVSNASNLRELSLPTIVTIYPSMLESLYNLSSIYCPNVLNIYYNGLRSLGYSCSNPVELNVPVLRYLYSSALMTANISKLYTPLLYNIYSAALNGVSNLKEVTASPVNIFYSAFYNCSRLESLYLLTRQVNVVVPALSNTNAFTNTPMADDTYLGYYGSIYVQSSLVENYKTATNWITYSDRITALPESFNSTYIYDYEFSGSTITEVPSERQNCKYVLRNAFRDCTNLSSVNLPECEYIDGGAFSNCTNLTYLSLPKCKYICETSAFVGCTKLTSVYLPECEETVGNVFAGCTSITSVNLPKCKRLIGNAFNACSKIASMSLPECEFIKDTPFNLTSLTSLNLPKCKILYGAIRTGYLESISLPECVAVLSSAFLQCNKLYSLELPKCVYIGNSAFASCAYLSKVSLPECISAHGSVFYYCSKLQEVYMPKCVQLPYFSNCWKLSRIILGDVIGSVPIFYSNPIVDSSYLGYYGSIYVPDSMVSKYQTYWESLSARITGISNLPSV